MVVNSMANKTGMETEIKNTEIDKINEIPYKTQLHITNLIIEAVVCFASLPLSEIVERCKRIDKTLDEKDILKVCKTIPFNKTYKNSNGELVGLYINCQIYYSKK